MNSNLTSKEGFPCKMLKFQIYKGILCTKQVSTTQTFFKQYNFGVKSIASSPKEKIVNWFDPINNMAGIDAFKRKRKCYFE